MAEAIGWVRDSGSASGGGRGHLALHGRRHRPVRPQGLAAAHGCAGRSQRGCPWRRRVVSVGAVRRLLPAPGFTVAARRTASLRLPVWRGSPPPRCRSPRPAAAAPPPPPPPPP